MVRRQENTGGRKKVRGGGKVLEACLGKIKEGRREKEVEKGKSRNCKREEKRISLMKGKGGIEKLEGYGKLR